MIWQLRLQRWAQRMVTAWAWTTGAALAMYAVLWACDKVLRAVVWVIS